ncbi:MAG: sarcosine oxidase subunit gamma family protein [Rothia sp. (in: high G+C Gram-positive bacteria)]|nr:sarcosine oxidase subunit gamma family protein [Rothia sp. (in: high G+C Gram-positive bacteria)]
MVEEGGLQSTASEFTQAMHSISNTDIQLRQIDHLTLIRIEVDPDSQAAQRMQEVLGVKFPQDPGQVTGDRQAVEILYGTRQIVACLRAEQATFLVVSQVDAVKLGRALSLALGDGPGLVLDVSANRSVLELSGPAAGQVLAQTVTFENSPPYFSQGMAFKCGVAQAEMMLWRIGQDQYLLVPRSSSTAPVLTSMLDVIAQFKKTC